MPPLPPAGVTPTDGKMIATLIHAGPGPQPLLDAAQRARAHAAELRDISTHLRTAATQLNQEWQSPAAEAAVGRLTTLAGWYDEHAHHAATAAQACETQAEAFAHTRATVPRPEAFDELERRLLAANQANTATGGRYTPVVTALHTQLAATHTHARTAYADYTTRAADLPTDTPTPPPPTVHAMDNHTYKQDPPPNPVPTPHPPSQIGPFPVPPQVAAAAPPGTPPLPDPTGGLLTPQNLPPAPPPPNIPGITTIPPAPGVTGAGGAPGKVFTWAPSGSDLATAAGGAVAGGTTDGVRQATLNAIAASPGTGPGAADPGLLKWLQDPSIGGVELKGFSRAGGVVGVASAVPAVMSDIGDGNSAAEAITRESAGTVVGLGAGAIVGDLAAGAAAGSIIPGAGTVVGAAAGAVVGALAALGASKGVEWLWE